MARMTALRLVLPVLRLEAEEVAQRHDLLHLIRLVLRPELLGLGQHPLRELYALNAIGKAGVVFIEAAHGLLRAVDIAQDQRLLSASRAVHGSGQPSRACSYYDDIMQANITIKKLPFKVDKGYVALRSGPEAGLFTRNVFRLEGDCRGCFVQHDSADSVAVITRRCQRLNSGSNPDRRIKLLVS